MEFSAEEYRARLYETQKEIVTHLLYAVTNAEKNGKDVFQDARDEARFVEGIVDDVLTNVVFGKPKLEKSSFGPKLSKFSNEDQKEIVGYLMKYEALLLQMKENNIQPILFSFSDLLTFLLDENYSELVSNASPFFAKALASSSTALVSSSSSSSSSSNVNNNENEDTDTDIQEPLWLADETTTYDEFIKQIRKNLPKRARIDELNARTEEANAQNLFLSYSPFTTFTPSQLLQQEENVRQLYEIVQQTYPKEAAKTQYLSKTFQDNIFQNITGYRTLNEITAYLQTNPSEASIVRNIYSRANFKSRIMFRIYKYCIQKGYLKAIAFMLAKYPEVWNENGFRISNDDGVAYRGKGNFVLVGLESTVVGRKKTESGISAQGRRKSPLDWETTEKIFDLIIRSKFFTGFPPDDSVKMMELLEEKLESWSPTLSDDKKYVANIVAKILENTIDSPTFSTDFSFRFLIELMLENKPSKVILFFTKFNLKEINNRLFHNYTTLVIFNPEIRTELASIGIVVNERMLQNSIRFNDKKLFDLAIESVQQVSEEIINEAMQNDWQGTFTEDRILKLLAKYNGPFHDFWLGRMGRFSQGTIIQILRDPRASVFTIEEYDKLSIRLFDADKIEALKVLLEIVREKFSEEFILNSFQAGKHLKKFFQLYFSNK